MLRKVEAVTLMHLKLFARTCISTFERCIVDSFHAFLNLIIFQLIMSYNILWIFRVRVKAIVFHHVLPKEKYVFIAAYIHKSDGNSGRFCNLRRLYPMPA